MDRLNKYNLILENTPSTNLFLKETLQKKKLPEFYSIRAKHQTAGRGQSGNRWESTPNKNLLCSILLYPTCVSANRSFYISQIISLSLIKLLKPFSDNFTIKWPNDIYWKDKKIAGILIENQFLSDWVNQSIIGIGLNINQQSFSKELSNPISLHNITKEEHNIDSLWQELIAYLKDYYILLQEGKAGQVKIEYHSMLYRKEGYHLYKDNKEEFKARLLRVQSDGQLILLDYNNKQRKYYFKEVSYII